MNPKFSLRTWFVLVLLFVTIMACSAPSLQDQIIGQWKIIEPDPNIAVIFSFKEDSSLTVWIEDVPVNGVYQWIDEDSIQITLIREEATQDIIGDVQITDDRMTIINETGDVDVLTRVE